MSRRPHRRVDQPEQLEDLLVGALVARPGRSGRGPPGPPRLALSGVTATGSGTVVNCRPRMSPRRAWRSPASRPSGRLRRRGSRLLLAAPQRRQAEQRARRARPSPRRACASIAITVGCRPCQTAQPSSPEPPAGSGSPSPTCSARRATRITAAARRPEKLTAAAEELRGAGFDVEEVAGNMADEDDIKRVVAAHKERFGRLDVLVNNAGVGVGAAAGEHVTKRIDLQLAVNLRAIVLFYRECVEMLQAPRARSTATRSWSTCPRSRASPGSRSCPSTRRPRRASSATRRR